MVLVLEGDRGVEFAQAEVGVVSVFVLNAEAGESLLFWLTASSCNLALVRDIT